MQGRAWESFYKVFEIKEDAYRPVTLKESFQDFLTNSRFNLENGAFMKLFKGKIVLSSKSPSATIFGKKFQKNKETNTNDSGSLAQELSDVIWFSYRRNFPILKSKSDPTKTFVSDTGWGCMIRVGQMMMAKVLKLNDKMDESIDLSFPGEDNYNLSSRQNIKIIKQFLDGETDPKIAPYSIQQIVLVASEIYNQDAGEWFKANMIAYCIDSCHENFGKKINHGLKLCVFSEGVIFLNQILEKARDERYSRKSFLAKKSMKSNPIEEAKEDEESQVQIGAPWENSVFIIIIVRLGIAKIPKNYNESIKTLLDSKFSVGIMGGIKSRALYILGHQNKNFIALDPHYVQESIQYIDGANQAATEAYLKTFYMPEPVTANIKEFDSSLAFGFFLKSEEDYLTFLEEMRLGDEKHKEWFIGVQEKYIDAKESIVSSENGEYGIFRLNSINDKK